jgi:RNA polymerase sigma-70 factor (ECF subfamily)
MSEGDPFPDLLRRVRSGDAAAAAQLVRDYEPVVRRAVRFRLRDAQLRRVLDESDICQSVLVSFFVRAAAGQFDLESPEQLMALLTRMAQNKLVTQRAKERSHKRGGGRLESLGGHEVVGPGPSPSEEVALQELIRKLRELLSPEERQLAELRTQGLGWAAIASQLGGSPEALRKQLDRAVEQATRQLGLEGVGHE